MPKKTLFFVFAFVLIILALSFVSAANIGYVVKTPSPLNSDEIIIRGMLIDEGHSVTILDDISFNAALYDFIIVGEDVPDISSIFDNKNHKTLFLSSTAAKNAGLSKYSGTTTNNKITISDNNHRITEYFNLGDLTVQNSLNTINYIEGCKAINSQSLAYRSYDYRYVILVLREDSLLLDASGSCSKRNVPIYERNLFFGLSKASEWNLNAEYLFINSINWMIEGEDADGDGYYYDEDCNDHDANKWQLLDGYLDNDNDGYGAGLLNDVCSGEGLPEGYSETNGDCDDSVASCNTDCVSLNYLDADKDDYGNLNEPHRACDASSDYVSNSNDCNDNNNEINPDAEEMQYDKIDQNCDNAAELSDEIPDIEWEEDKKTSIDLNSYIWNPNNNELEFYIYNSPDKKDISIGSIENGVVNFSSDENWWGDDWIVFGIYEEDTDTNLVSNEIILRVLPVNDAPEFIREIENIIFEEDTELTNRLNLNDYFYDFDEDELAFSVVGNTFINVILDNGLVSFIPDSNWFGVENIIFSAFDGEYNKESNEITLTVEDANEPPEFNEINCLSDIDEDTEYTCILNASDFENDELSFSVADENDLNCKIEGDELTYIPKLNYNGEASCMIKVSDERDYAEYLLEVNVLPVNDAPVIKSYSPLEPIVLMENTSQIFSVTAFDIDGDSLEIKWFVDDVEVANGVFYTLNKEKGNYNLTVSVTDNIADPATKTWDVFVGDISDFTCQEVDGYTIENNEICSGNLLGTSDSNLITCCSVPGSPKFSDIDRCNNLSPDLKFKIEDPDENDKFMIGENIKVKIKIENNFDEDLDFDVNAYLYDISEDDEIEDYDDTISVDENKDEMLEFEFLIPDNVDEEKDYAVFVKIIDEDEKYCNENYVKINIEREKYKVIIQNVKINSEIACGDYLNAEIKVKNIGSKDDDIYLVIENSDLNISEKIEEFELEKYDEDDTETKTISIKTPEGVNEGNYEMKITAFFDSGNEKYSVTKDLFVQCKQIKIESKPLEKITLNADSLNINTAQTQTKDNKKIIVLGMIMLSALIVIIILLNTNFKGGKNDY